MAVISDIADAVVAELKGTTFSLAIQAERKDLPVLVANEMGSTVFATVVPKSWQPTAEGRSAESSLYAVDIGIQKRVTVNNLVESDELRDLVEEIYVHFRDLGRLSTYPEARFMSGTNDPVHSPEQLQELGIFTSVLTLFFRV